MNTPHLPKPHQATPRSAALSSGRPAVSNHGQVSHTRCSWILAALLLVAGTASGQEARTMKIRLTIDGNAVDATLLDNATARDFLSLLPLTVTLDDYLSTEKILYLSRKLSTAGAPAGADPAPGDIAYYAPWGNLAIYYKDAAYATGVVKLGRVDSGIERLSVPGSLKATIKQQ